MFLKSITRSFFLVFVSIEFASAATLVCKEKAGSDGELSCDLKVNYDEIATAWNMNCEPSDDGLNCNFEARTKGRKTTNIATPTAFEIAECSEEGVCINSVVSTVLTISDNPKATTDGSENTKQPYNGIRIGSYEYKEPFEQYAEPIERTLRARAPLWKTPPKDIGTEYALANAHLDLGISHFTAVTEEDYSPGTHSDRAPESFDLKLAVNAFKVAEKMYLSILRKYDNEKSVIYKSLAALYLQWGEVYQNSHYFDDEVEEDEEVEFNKLALDRYQQAEKYYRLSLENSDDGGATEASIKDTKVNLAHVSHRIGRCLINSIQRATVVQEEIPLSSETGDQTAEVLRNALPQLEMLIHTVPNAEKHFAEAIRLYRVAIDDEADFVAKTRLKLNLATTLQDAGTAASYASNIRKAIQLQEEGVEVSKEILPHVGTADRLFLLQYIADSMYGLANHYMQLGEYEKTKSTYRAAMHWYQKHNLGPALVAPSFEVGDDSLEAYEKQLADYHALVREVTMPDGYPDDGQAMYGPNDAYEADLHAALGSIHLSRDENLMAIDHFNEAIRLYEKDASEENLDRSIADVKVSLASAYFKDGDFAKSIEAHDEAMDIYKVEVGDGKNPMLAGLAAQLGENVDVNEILEASDLSELLLSAELQNLVAGLGANDLTDKLEKLSKAKKGSDQAGDSNKADEKEKAKGSEQKVHEQLIDAETIEKVRQSVLINVTSTSMKGEL